MRIYANVPFKEKEEAKSLGAKWDAERKQWYFNYDISLVDDNKYIKIRKWNPVFEKSQFMPFHFIVISNGLDIELSKKTIRRLKWFSNGEITLKYSYDGMVVHYDLENNKKDYLFSDEAEEIFLKEYSLLLEEINKKMPETNSAV